MISEISLLRLGIMNRTVHKTTFKTLALANKTPTGFGAGKSETSLAQPKWMTETLAKAETTCREQNGIITRKEPRTKIWNPKIRGTVYECWNHRGRKHRTAVIS